MSTQGVSPGVLVIPQNAAFECEAMFWPDTDDVRDGGSGSVLGGNGEPGHAALLLRRLVDQGPWAISGPAGLPAAYNPVNIRYVSVWFSSPWVSNPLFTKPTRFGMTNGFAPHHLLDYEGQLPINHAQRLAVGRAATIGQTVIGSFNRSGSSDLQDIWGLLPKDRVTLTALANMRTTMLGLDLNRMVTWALAFMSGPEYTPPSLFARPSSAGVAVRALCAGGAEAFSALGGNPTQGSILMPSKEALLWTQGVARGIRETNFCLSYLQKVAVAQPAGTDLPSVAAWQQASSARLNLRGRNARAIDGDLATYQSVTWPGSFVTKLAALVCVIRRTRDHFQESGLAKDAYRFLAGCILSTVNTVSAFSNAPWSGASYYATPSRMYFNGGPR